MIQTSGQVASVHVADKDSARLVNYIAAVLKALIEDTTASTCMFVVKVDQTPRGRDIRIERIVSLGA